MGQVACSGFIRTFSEIHKSKPKQWAKIWHWLISHGNKAWLVVPKLKQSAEESAVNGGIEQSSQWCYEIVFFKNCESPQPWEILEHIIINVWKKILGWWVHLYGKLAADRYIQTHARMTKRIITFGWVCFECLYFELAVEQYFVSTLGRIKSVQY